MHRVQEWGRESSDKLPLGNSFKEQVEYIGLAYLDGPNYSHGGNVTDWFFFFLFENCDTNTM